MVFGTVFLWILICALCIWVGVLTYLLLKTVSNYNRLTEGVHDKTLSELLKDILTEKKQTQKIVEKLSEEVKDAQKDVLKGFQKVGLVRFNPFSEIGGDQSFSLALLDGHSDGIIITSLYSRSGTRWYIKTIKAGKGVEHELSQEEKQALKSVKGV